jgi:hypothetical protein
MKKLIISLIGTMALYSTAFGGTESYSGKDKVVQQAAPFCGWYADQEWNVSVWGTYAFTGTKYLEDRYLGVDHAWGGGVDAKYFFGRYFGLGVEGYGLALNESRGIRFFAGNGLADDNDRRGSAGAVLGTFTFRYPLPCSRIAPYVFGGGGVIFGGGGREDVVLDNDGTIINVTRNDTSSELIGQFGGGFEVRLTPHIGLINDFSWNVVDGRKNNFGMARTGINFSF